MGFPWSSVCTVFAHSSICCYIITFIIAAAAVYSCIVVLAGISFKAVHVVPFRSFTSFEKVRSIDRQLRCKFFSLFRRRLYFDMCLFGYSVNPFTGRHHGAFVS